MLWSLIWSLVEFKGTQKAIEVANLLAECVVFSIWGGVVLVSLLGYIFTCTHSVVWVFTTVGVQDAGLKDEHPG